MHRRAFTAALAALTVGLPTRFRASAQPDASPTGESRFRAIDVDGIPIALSPDGTMIAGVTSDHTIAIWDATTFDRITASDPVDELRLLDHRSLAWSPDGRALAFSLDGLRTMRDSDIYTVVIETGTVANLTAETANDDPAASLLDATPANPLHMDLFPSWSPDGLQIAITRTTSSGEGDEQSTELMTIPREGGEAQPVATLSVDTPFLVSGPMTWLDDGSILYATWPPRPDDASGIFLALPDGSVEIVTTGLLAASMPNPLLVDVNPDAGLASVVSSTNLARGLGDPDADITFLVDLRTGIPTPVSDIVPLPSQTGSSLDDYTFISPPAVTTEGASTLLTYALFARDTTDVWQHDMTTGNTSHLGTLPPPVAGAATRAYYPSISIAANRAIFVTGWNGTWIATP